LKDTAPGIITRAATIKKRAFKVYLLDPKLFASLLNNRCNGRVVDVTRRWKQVVFDLVAQAAADKIPEQ
jgi:hypothetical protein